MRPLAVLGNLARDVVDGGRPRVGGGPYYAARALRLLARRGRIATRCAEEDRPLLRALVDLGVPVTWRAAEATASFAIAYDGERRALTIETLGEPWAPEDVRGWAAPALRDAGWIHVAALARSDFPPETLAAIARRGRVSLDGQGLVRPGRTGPVELDADFDPAMLAHVALLKLSEEEARTLGALDEGGVRALGVPEVVVTLGSRGSVVWSGGGLEPVPAVSVAGGADPTGAGDSFTVAYLAARASGHGPAASARRASHLVAALLSGAR